MRARQAGTEAETLHHAGAKALDQPVGLLDQFQHHLDGGGIFQIDTHRLAVAQAESNSTGRGAPATAPLRSTRITVAPRSARNMCGQWAGADARDLDDPDARERAVADGAADMVRSLLVAQLLQAILGQLEQPR